MDISPPSYILFSDTRNAGYGIKEVLYHNSSCFTLVHCDGYNLDKDSCMTPRGNASSRAAVSTESR